MDRKSFIVLALCFIFLMVWHSFVNKMFPPTPLPKSTNLVSSATNRVTPATNSAAPTYQPLPTAPAPATPLPTPAQPEEPEALVQLESEDARYIFTSHGGGLKRVELKKFDATIPCGRFKALADATNNAAKLNDPAPAPVLALLGEADLQGDGVFELQKTATGVRAAKTLTNGLAIVKTFELSTNFLIKASVRLENTAGQPINVPYQELVVGTSTPIGKMDESLMLGFQWYNGAKAEEVGLSWFENRTLGCFPGTPRAEYVAGASNVFWASVHNQFFAIAAVPEQPAPRLIGRKIDLPPPSKEQIAADAGVMRKPVGYQTALLYPGALLPPGETIERQFTIYAGPKEYNTLARLGGELDLIMKFGFFGFFAKALLLSMNGLHALGLTYGLAIVAITITIKLLFWPLTNASTKSMKRMAALQPEMKALQEKYKDDPKKMNMKLMEFMKEKKVSPLAGCLPMLLQIPVFIGFYQMLQSAIELRGAGFLWACDLSQPDTVATIPGLGFPVNPMPLLMGLTMLWQARMTPPAPGMDPMQQKIMKYMPLIFMVFLYNFSAGLTLYWTVQNLLTIAQMKITKTADPTPQPAAKPVAPGPKPSPPKKKHRP